MAQLDQLLSYLKENDCSDLHLAAGLEPRVRAKGSVRTIEGRPRLSDEELRGMLAEIALPKHWNEFVEIDPQFYRPAEVDYLQADITNLTETLGWVPETTFDELVREMVDADMKLYASTR